MQARQLVFNDDVGKQFQLWPARKPETVTCLPRDQDKTGDSENTTLNRDLTQDKARGADVSVPRHEIRPPLKSSRTEPLKSMQLAFCQERPKGHEPDTTSITADGKKTA